MLKNGTVYQDLGANHFEKDKERQIARLVKGLGNLGFEVTSPWPPEVGALATSRSPGRSGPISPLFVVGRKIGPFEE